MRTCDICSKELRLWVCEYRYKKLETEKSMCEDCIQTMAFLQRRDVDCNIKKLYMIQETRDMPMFGENHRYASTTKDLIQRIDIMLERVRR